MLMCIWIPISPVEVRQTCHNSEALAWREGSNLRQIRWLEDIAAKIADRGRGLARAPTPLWGWTGQSPDNPEYKSAGHESRSH